MKQIQQRECGLFALASMLANGERTVRNLLLTGELDLALAQARWLLEAGHPKGRALVRKAERAIREKRVRNIQPAEVAPVS